jgi:large subunit ribosomal protein L13
MSKETTPQRSYMATARTEPRTWYVLDADGQVLGRLATQAASLLRGKHKPTYTPHADMGDGVIVINAAKVRLTGRKLDQKLLRRHSGYLGGLKEIPYRQVMRDRPELAVERAIKGMLPHTRLGADMYRRLRVYRGSEHPHAAQAPVPWTGPERRGASGEEG